MAFFQNRDKGFTLLELMIAIAIVGVLAAISIPTMQPFMAQRRLNGAARQIYSDMAAMRIRAISENKWIAMVIDNNHTYSIFRDNAQSGSKTSSGNQILNVKDIHQTYQDVYISTNPGTIVLFKPDGTSNSSTITTITLNSISVTGTKSLTINTSGNIQIN